MCIRDRKQTVRITGYLNSSKMVVGKITTVSVFGVTMLESIKNKLNKSLNAAGMEVKHCEYKCVLSSVYANDI